MKKLPIGIQSFVKIRSDGFYYVDKTRYIRMLVDEGAGYFFLSRPRRFGKSLFLDTLKQAFLGKKELFEGLYLEKNWDWSERCPVIHISFGSGVYKSVDELEYTQLSILEDHAESYGVSLTKKTIRERFMQLIKALHEEIGKKVVILVDEYDKPILDNIEDPQMAIKMRESLKNFYSVIKDADEHLKFVFITGVTKFSKVSIFSGLNNLKDITINPKYGAICGYTQQEFEEVFKDRLEGVDLDEVKLWYNGYSWLSERVYNPFDILLYLDMKDFRPYWFETGTPTFLIKLILEKKLSLAEFERLEVGDEILESFDVDRIYPQMLLFQTGYLTIIEKKKRGYMNKYILSWPNLEVSMSFSNYLLATFTDLVEKERNLDELYTAFEEADFKRLEGAVRSIFASIPHDWFRKNRISEYEGFYASVLYSYMTALGLEVRAEDATSRGRIDMAVRFGKRCYIFEFKVVEKVERKALAQIKEKGYHRKYIKDCDEIYLIGIEFSSKERGVVSFEHERVK